MLILSYDYPPNDGGISRLSVGIVEELFRRGQVLRVITTRKEQAEGLARPNCPHLEVSPVLGRREWGTFSGLLAVPLAHPIIATVWNPEASVAMLALRKRVTILAHGNEVMDYRAKPFKARLRRLILERARAVVCNSAYTAGLVAGIAPAARTFVINPAVDTDRFTYPLGEVAARKALNLPQDRRIIVTVARLEPMKGHDTVLRAIAALSPHERSLICYVIAGKGAFGATLRRMVADLELDDVVRFTGFLSEAELPALYAAADLFLLCSFEDPQRNAVEGFGMVFTEAQAAGLAVLGTRSGGIPDAVRHGEGGWLVDERDHAEVSKYLERLCADASPFVREGVRGRQRVLREMSWASYVDRLLEVI